MTRRKKDDGFIRSLEWDINRDQPGPTGMKGVKVISDAEYDRIRGKEFAGMGRGPWKRK